jgi:hypothetical protein
MNTADGSKNVPLWLLGVPVSAWALHFLAVYVVAAVYCAKNAVPETAMATPLSSVRWPIIVITLAALAVDAVAAWRARAGLKDAPATGSRSGQNPFLGSVTLMLCALSAAAMVGVATVSLFFGDCRQ